MSLSVKYIRNLQNRIFTGTDFRVIRIGLFHLHDLHHAGLHHLQAEDQDQPSHLHSFPLHPSQPVLPHVGRNLCRPSQCLPISEANLLHCIHCVGNEPWPVFSINCYTSQFPCPRVTQVNHNQPVQNSFKFIHNHYSFLYQKQYFTVKICYIFLYVIVIFCCRFCILFLT